MDIGKILGAAGNVLATVAPTIATALGGPLAGTAVTQLEKWLGVEPGSASADDITKAVVGATPEQLGALKKLDYDYQLAMSQQGIDILKIDAGDRDSARLRQRELKDHAPEFLGTLIIAGFLTCVYAVLAGYVDGLKDPLTAGLVGTLIGYVSAKADQVVSYYFGSSKGSRDKDITIGKLTK